MAGSSRAALAAGLVALSLPVASVAQQSDEELAKKLSNPIASLISVPFQYNYDRDFGPAREGHKSYVNFQPVVPAKLNDEWTLISRIIVPLVDQHIPSVGDGSQSGVGDVVGEFFFVPAKPGPDGVIWGVGPAMLIPSGVDGISADKWAFGVTGVVLKQEHGWTYGLLANHLWSTGGSGPTSISATYLQPFLNYTTHDQWTFGLDAESSYDWKSEQWTLPFNLTVSKLLRLGKLPVSIGGGVRYWADGPSGGPHGWGARAIVTLLFPT